MSAAEYFIGTVRCVHCGATILKTKPMPAESCDMAEMGMRMTPCPNADHNWNAGDEANPRMLGDMKNSVDWTPTADPTTPAMVGELREEMRALREGQDRVVGAIESLVAALRPAAPQNRSDPERSDPDELRRPLSG